MNEKKLTNILDDMDGITYLEWQKLEMCINNYFRVESRKQSNDIQLTGNRAIIERYKCCDFGI